MVVITLVVGVVVGYVLGKVMTDTTQEEELDIHEMVGGKWIQ